MKTRTFVNSDDPVDTLHIPNIGGHHWIEVTSKESISSSLNDRDLRPISLHFFLEDPRARTPYVAITIKKEIHFSHNLSMEMNEKRIVDFWLEPDKDGRHVILKCYVLVDLK